jgi:hypothetical protein
LIVKAYVPATAVPLRVALVVLVDVVNEAHDGSVEMLQVNGAVPVPGPTENVCEYASPAVAAPKGGAGEITGIPFTVILYVCDAAAPRLSVTVTPNV